MKTLTVPGMNQDETNVLECDATAMVDWKEGGDAFLEAFDEQLKPYGLEVVCWDTGQATSVWKVQRIGE